jgi:hypothetical protein
MSRSGYSDDCDGWALIRWRGAVNSAIKGKRGQAFLRETLAALDAMPEKKLAADSLHDQVEGQFCTLGAVGAVRGIDMKPLEEADRDVIANAFGISEALAAEIMFENDERYGWMENNTPERRWSRMRSWIESHLTNPIKEIA